MAAVAAAMMLGQQLMKNLRQPKPGFAPTTFGGRAPRPSYQAPSYQAPQGGGGIRSMIMDAFLKSQMGVGATPSNFAPPRGRLPGEIRPMEQASMAPGNPYGY